MPSSRAFVLSVSMLLAIHAHAQQPSRFMTAASQSPDLEFPTEPSPLSLEPRMALFRPEGSGPFPALILLHQCAGLTGGAKPNTSMMAWAKAAVERGYAALVIDSLGPRGVTSVCGGPRGGVNFARGVRDVMQAAEHLRSLDYVDKGRIAMAGYSWGAMVAVLASSKRWASALAPGERIGAAVSFYPGCFTLRPAQGTPYEVVNPDIDRPLLVLMGEQDTETPASDCVSRLEPLRAAGAPVEWHVYPGATHCWDCRQLDGFSKTSNRGAHVAYRYDASITEDSARRMFDFLDKALARR